MYVGARLSIWHIEINSAIQEDNGLLESPVYKGQRLNLRQIIEAEDEFYSNYERT